MDERKGSESTENNERGEEETKGVKEFINGTTTMKTSSSSSSSSIPLVVKDYPTHKNHHHDESEEERKGGERERKLKEEEEGGGDTSSSSTVFVARKIIDKIHERIRLNEICTSFEFFPAKTEKGTNNLLSRVHNMRARLNPTFVTLTWRSAFKNEDLWVKIGRTIQNEFHIEVLMHLTCHLPVQDLKRILKNCRENGLRNILALRGDPPIGQDRWKRREGCLNNALELVQLIRQEHGDYFCIAVAGYPESHIETWNSRHLPPSDQCRAVDVSRLKKKLDAGGDFVISQFFFDVERFLRFQVECEAASIRCPILPGYLPIQNYKSYRKFTTWCKTHVPPKVVDALEAIKDNDQAVKAYGIQLAIDTMRRLMRGGCKTLHFYTMNLSVAVTKILQGLKLVSEIRQLPWKMPQQRRGCSGAKELVRPIFWSQRPLSYISRTRSWGEFPNGRWGDAASPAFGDLTEYYLAFKRKTKADLRLKQWGTPQTLNEVYDVFRRIVLGEVTCTPWNDEAMSSESSLITDQLEFMNANGFLTINSQPRVNAASSEDERVGWGGEGGYVFQKAYVEFFTSPKTFQRLLKLFSQYPSLSYHAINKRGDEYTNVRPSKQKGQEPVNAVTWGVFPGREIIQPTVVDPSSFRAWKDEAFELWLTQWASVYVDDGDAKQQRSKEIVREINETFVLVNIVDNDYSNPESDIFDIFRRLVLSNMDQQQMQTYLADAEKKKLRIRKKLLSANAAKKDLAERLKRSEEDCAALMAENRKLKAQIEYQRTMRSRALSS